MRTEVYISKKKADYINKLLTVQPHSKKECFGEDEKISVKATFKDGTYAYIDCCGVQYEEDGNNLAYTQAVLYDKTGKQLAYTEPEDEFLGLWMFRLFKDNSVMEHEEYIVDVLIK